MKNLFCLSLLSIYLTSCGTSNNSHVSSVHRTINSRQIFYDHQMTFSGSEDSLAAKIFRSLESSVGKPGIESANEGMTITLQNDDFNAAPDRIRCTKASSNYSCEFFNVTAKNALGDGFVEIGFGLEGQATSGLYHALNNSKESTLISEDYTTFGRVIGLQQGDEKLTCQHIADNRQPCASNGDQQNKGGRKSKTCDLSPLPNQYVCKYLGAIIPVKMLP
ncbi:MAG: hypothetical protein NT027_14755 [Proteobacteria bacterium]|nr:hypothetical protein [Pseudomonadota bacterium]